MEVEFRTLLAATSKSTNFTTTSEDIIRFDRYSVVVTVSAAADLDLDVCLQGSVNDADWSDLQGSEVSLTGNDNITYNVHEVGYRYFRLSFTILTGSATIAIQSVMKG